MNDRVEFEEEEYVTDIMRQNKVKRDLLDNEWQAKSLEVLEAESNHREISEQVAEKLMIVKRIDFVGAGNRKVLSKCQRRQVVLGIPSRHSVTGSLECLGGVMIVC